MMLNLNTLSFNSTLTRPAPKAERETTLITCDPRFGMAPLDTLTLSSLTSSGKALQTRVQHWAQQFWASTLANDTLRCIEDLTPSRLRNLGDVHGVIFDLDDTLMPLLSGKFPSGIIESLQRIQRAGFKMGIVTNNIQPEYCRRARVQLAQAGLYLPFIQDARKPHPSGFEQMRERFGLSLDQIAVVGDGVLSDVRCANLLGMKSVRAMWFRQSTIGIACSYLQDALAMTFNGFRHFVSGQNRLAVIEPYEINMANLGHT